MTIKRNILFFTLIFASVPVLAAGQSPAEELSRRSGLPADEVNALLADCDANQASMNFCAWRDQIATEQDLRQILDEKGRASA